MITGTFIINMNYTTYDIHDPKTPDNSLHSDNNLSLKSQGVGLTIIKFSDLCL